MVRHHVFGFTALALLACTSYATSGCGGNTATNNQPQTHDDGGEEGGTTMEAGGSGSSSGGSGDSGSKDSGGEAGQDGGHTPSSMYPAFPVDVAQIANNNGPVLSAAKIVTVSWSSDPTASTWNGYSDGIGATKYWNAVGSEYGVGAASGGGHVSITTPPPSEMSDSDLDTFVSSNAANPSSGWPASDANTLYAIFMAPTTALYFGGAPDAGGQDACQQGIGGYHSETQSGGYVYAIMPHCNMFQTADIEVSASHEFIEASTDPHPFTKTGYAGFDADHLANEFFNAFQDEDADACENFTWAYYTDTETTFPNPVQRSWSNKSAKAGHNPCVPAPADPFYNVTAFPSELTTVNVNLSALGMGAGMTQTKGYKGTLNQPLTFHLGAFSDAPTSGPWALTAIVDTFQFPDQNGNALNNGAATVTLDKSSVINGDMITVTVTPTNWGSLGVVEIFFKSLLPGKTSNDPHGDYPIIVSQN